MPDASEPDPRTVRMEPLATLPVFFKLNGRRVVMAGGDAAAAWKVELLAAAGAHVDVFAQVPCEDLVQLASAPPCGAVVLILREWAPPDLRGAALAIAAIEDDREAAAFRDAACGAGVPVNVVDNPSFCDFQFGTVVARSPLVIGISTDGGAPVFGQALRARLEALFPQSFRAWAQAAKDWRPAVQARRFDFRQRRRFWEAFTALALNAGDRPPTVDDQALCIASVDVDAVTSRSRLTLVGSGSGFVDSVTFAAARVLQSADIVVFDPDVSDAVVGLARREAIKIPVSSTDEDTIAVLRTQVSAGKQAVWLGTGDPAQCRRWHARRDALDHLHIQSEIVSGVSTCPACAGVCRTPTVFLEGRQAPAF